MSRIMSPPWPGKNFPPCCHPNVLVEFAFWMMSMFSDSSSARNLTTCFAFSEVTVQPRSARAVIPLAVNTILRRKMALCHLPSLLKAISIFSSPVSAFLRRCVKIMGVLQITSSKYFTPSILAIPFSEKAHPTGCRKFTGAPERASGISSFSISTASALLIAFFILSAASSLPYLIYTSEGSLHPRARQLHLYTFPRKLPSLSAVVTLCRKTCPPLSGST